ncbi:MAG TPA: hypothetical protein HPQ03_07665 [Deltaproteobacteria bacterium]|nr:hypothetical protein [Deltaproteobacteria bacterium]
MTDVEFHTATMARVYAQQGHFQKAAEIYRHILSNEPDRQDIATELSMVEQKSADMEQEQEKDTRESDLVYLFQKWFQTAARHRRIETLKRLKQHFSTQR